MAISDGFCKCANRLSAVYVGLNFPRMRRSVSDPEVAERSSSQLASPLSALMAAVYVICRRSRERPFVQATAWRPLLGG